MKIIGITGKSGSGKTTLAEQLAKKLQCTCVNVDKIGHTAIKDEQIFLKLCRAFGSEILNESQKIDRKKLGNMVFSNKEKMDLLTEITWDYMQEVLDEILAKERKQIIILEWALLPISKYWEKCDVKILLKADEKERKMQVIQRDQISEEYFLKREKESIHYEKYVFDHEFQNDYKIETIKTIIDTIK